MHLANVLPGSSSVQVMVDSEILRTTVLGFWLITSVDHKTVSDSQKVGNVITN